MSFDSVSIVNRLKISLLVKKAKKGDKEAFAQLYRNLVTRVYRFTLVRVGREEDAEDITEIVFVKVLENLAKYEGDGISFLGWVFRIARNAIIDHYRQGKKKTQSLEVTFDLGEEDKTLDNLVSQEEFKVLLKGINELSKLEKELVMLKYFEDISYKEIGKIVGKSEGATRVKVHRAVEKLRRKLNEKF